MNDVCMVYVSLSLSGSLISLILYLLRPVYKNRLTKTWQYYIFIIVILRLLIPVSPAHNLINFIINQTGNPFYTENALPFNLPDLNNAPQMALPEIPTRQEANIDSADISRSAAQIAIDAIWLGWLVPVLILLIRKVIGYCRMVRVIKEGCIRIDYLPILDIYREISKTMKIKRPPTLVYNEAVSAPMLVGIIRPVIVLSEINLKPQDLHYVFQHELTHYKRLDILYKWLAQITLCLHWFNPFIYWVHREINRNCELSCDEAIIKRLNETEKKAYGDMLLKAIKLYKNPHQSVVSVMLHEDTKLIRERLVSIMQFKKMSNVGMVISLVLVVFLMCGAMYTGVYAWTKEAQTGAIPERTEIPVNNLPDKVQYDQVPSTSKLQFGLYDLDTAETYALTISWLDGSDNLKLFLVGPDGHEEECMLSNGKSKEIQVPIKGLYYFYAPRDRETGDMRTLSFAFSVKDASTIKAPVNPTAPARASENSPTVAYESVDMRHYEPSSGSIPAHPYIHDIKTNSTHKKIVAHQRGMLAFDKDGKPLRIDWFSTDSDRESAYYFLYDWGSTEIPPGETDDVYGGWSLNIKGDDPAVSEIAYVLYCDKEITFEDGTIWKNPDFDNWRSNYEGKTIDVQILQNYYPYVQKITF